MAGARDRYQLTDDQQQRLDESEARRRAYRQAECVRRTLYACFNSPNRKTPGTFAHDVIQAAMAEGLTPDNLWRLWRLLAAVAQLRRFAERQAAKR